jgi:hypothetical protein
MKRAAMAMLAALVTSPAFCQVIVPDPTLTPGAVRTTDAFDVCSHGTAQLRHMNRDRSDAIMAKYGLPAGPHEAYEIDHLIPLSIGGSDDDQNLWPQPRRMIEIGMERRAEGRPRNAAAQPRVCWPDRDHRRSEGHRGRLDRGLAALRPLLSPVGEIPFD